jgi:ubiquitin carboxyl-terminal hydrolase 8
MSNDLAYNSIDELDKAYALDKTLEFNKPAVCNTLLKLYDQGNKSLNLGDEEKSYGCLMRFVDGSMKLRKSNLYKDDPGYVETMIPKDKIATTLGKLETLKKSLRIRYEMKGLDSKLPKDEKQPTPAANKSVNPTKPGVNSSSARKAITPQELLEMLTRSTDKILIIDTRSKSEFSNSQMNFSIQLSSDKKRQEQISYINIPNEFVDGVTWNIMDKLSGENAAAAKIFGNRKAFDQLVLLDSASHFNNLTRESKLLILKRAIYEFDQDEKLSNEPLILDGGFSQWLVFYPGFTTNTAVTASSNIATIKIQPEQHSSIKKLISFDYPELEIKPKPPPVISPLTAVTPIVTTSVKDNADEQLAVSNDSRNVESDSKPVIKDDKSSTLFESAANKPPQQPAQNNSLQQHKMPNFDRSNKPSNKAIITIPSSSSDEKLTLIPPKATFEVGLSDDEENTELTFPKLSNQKPVERNENNTQYQNDFAQLNLNKEPSQQNANSNNTLKINIGKPNLVKPAEVANDSELNSEILRSVYHTTRRPTQMPYMNGASKVLDVRTGIYTTYIPASKMSSVPGNNSTAAQLPDEPTELKFVPPRPKKEPLQKKMDQPKASKFAGSSLKRTVSSPNIDKLDDEIVDETAHNELESKANVQSFFKKQDPRPTLPSPLPQFNTTPVAATLTASQKPTIPAPNVNRNNKPLPDHEIQMRIRDLQPVYGSARQGLVGVRNLGNTCFMNSVLQCLLSTRKLVTYFVKDQYKLDLNRDNHLGFGGQIADEYAVIVRAVWDGQCRIIAPRRFKALIGQFNEQFVSNDQQDAQEFLLFLLDGLHEDLNRVSHLNF